MTGIAISLILLLQSFWREQYVPAARRQRFVAIALGLEAHEYLGLPSQYYSDQNGTPLYSWRYRIAPYVHSYKRQTHFEVPWSHADNFEWRDVRHPYWVKSWGDGWGNGEIDNLTDVFAVTGTGTGFGSGGEVGANRLRNLPANLILVVQLKKNGVDWMQPGDFSVDMGNLNKRLAEQIPSQGGFHVIFADLTVWRLSSDTPPTVLRKFMTIELAESHERALLKPWQDDP